MIPNFSNLLLNLKTCIQISSSVKPERGRATDLLPCREEEDGSSACKEEMINAQVTYCCAGKKEREAQLCREEKPTTRRKCAQHKGTTWLHKLGFNIGHTGS
ncbi:putative pericentriolar material 1 protein isoform X1 [Sesbania bispinosa]|nr:putative pericentriolar material 1 protein isoform X1 [Sesbania bispinosa]